MIYPEKLDTALKEFCAENGLHLSTAYQDVEVRSISVVDDQASSYQIWIDRSQQHWAVKVSDNDLRQGEFIVDGSDYAGALRGAYCQIEDWMDSDGHSRSAA